MDKTKPQADHFKNLKKMYSRAKVNSHFTQQLDISPQEAVVTIKVDESYFHSGGALHGAIYFKAMDDAAYFAASAFEMDYFLVTNSFTTYITRPVSKGHLRAVGRVVNKTRSQFIVEAICYNEDNKEVARANGIMMRSQMRLADVADYTE